MQLIFFFIEVKLAYDIMLVLGTRRDSIFIHIVEFL